MSKIEEPTDSSRGPQEVNNSSILKQKPGGGSKDSELAIIRGSELLDELESELNKTRLRDEGLGIRPGATVRGTLEARNAGIHWGFLEERLNFIEPGSSYHGEFVGRIGNIRGDVANLAVIAWRPVFGEPQEYTRFAEFTRKSFNSIRLWNPIIPKLGVKVGDLVEFVAKVTVYVNSVDFQIPIIRLKLLQPMGPEEVQGHAS
jgi:hypothetical protein